MTRALLHILKIFANVKIPSPPLQPPVTYLINALINLDLEDKKARHFATNPVFPKFDPMINARRFVGILDSAVREYKEEELEKLLCPLLTVIRKVFDFAPDPVRQQMRSMLLPSDEERAKPLGKSDTLPSLLLHLSTSPVAPNLREAIQHMLFELSDRNATNFVRNVGYGFAAGFLIGHDVPVPENALEAWSTDQGPGANGTKPGRAQINPVTGQRIDMEAPDPGAEMTMEEKEREADRLFVLFER
jgi:hypothetical protein